MELPSWDEGTSWALAVSGGLTTATATAPVAALVSVSSLSPSSVKDTLTLMALPASAATRV